MVTYPPEANCRAMVPLYEGGRGIWFFGDHCQPPSKVLFNSTSAAEHTFPLPSWYSQELPPHPANM